jgi:uncharacterized protein (DUF1330 family)
MADDQPAGKGYVVVTEAIHDQAGIQSYGRMAGPTVAEYGGQVLVADDNCEVVEGQWHGERTVIVEFESVAQARAWYESPGYQSALLLRQAAAESNAVILAGFVGPAQS